MSVIIFIIVLGVLIFVHELGHFLVAKRAGIRVDEFAIGFPPKIFSFKKGETKYSLNLIPFGGFVKIYGEDGEGDSSAPNSKDSFINKSPWIQAAVLVAGVSFNVIFAWLIFWIVLMAGSPTIVNDQNRADVKEAHVTITNVLENSPAKNAGIETGDKIISIESRRTSIEEEDLTTQTVKDTITSSEGQIKITVDRMGETKEISITPITGINGNDKAIGVSLDEIGIYSLPFHTAFIESFGMTWRALELVTVNLITFIGQAIMGKATLDEISGPVGIVGIVGDAAEVGIVYLLTFTAFISIHLAVLNILPFPALDGGRLLLVFIESITRRKINPVVVGWINGLGFAFLILVMILVTINDISKIFG